MNTIEVRILDSEDYPFWDNLVKLSPSGTIFHESPWLISAGRASEVETNIFGAFYSDQLVGGCAIHSHKIGGLFTSATTTLPLTPYGGVIMQFHESTNVRETEKRESSVINSLVSAIQNKQPHMLTLTMSPQVIDIRPYTWQGWNASVNYCYIFPLSGNITDHISKKVRWSISKAKKLGIVSKQTWDKDIYWDLTLNTYQKQGRPPPFSKELLFSLIDKIRENQWGEMWIAESTSGVVVAAEIIIWDHQMAYRWSAASHDQFKNTGATSYLLFDLMTHLQEKDFKKINMMAANTPNLTKFISSFNPELIPYYTVTKSRGIFPIINAFRQIIRLM